jgi:CubicO group peptidase (beta-lactamase class C family)
LVEKLNIVKKLLILILGISTLSFNINAQVETDDQTRIDSLFKQWDSENSPGAVIGIIQEGKLIYTKGYGMGNLDYRIPLSADSKFYIASTSKQFTAACIALLSIEGKIRLDDEIQKYIPEIPNYGEKITIRNLVHHTSGLRDYLSLMYLSGKSFEDYFTIDDGIKLLTKQIDSNFSPGEEYLYSNSGYILLAEIVNRVSGMTIREYADKYIFQPLGMTNTFFNDDHSQITKNRVISYRNQSGTLKRFVQNFDALGDGNLLTTVNDMYLWDQNFYHKKVGSKEFNDIMLTQGKLDNGDTLQYAFGLFHGKYKGLKTVSHGGGFLGFRTEFVRFPKQNFSVIVFSNVSDFSPAEKAYRIADILLENELSFNTIEELNPKKLAINPIQSTNKILEQFSALYWNDKDGYSRKIYLKNDTLRYYRNEESESVLLPISRNEFKMLDEADEVIVTFDLKEKEADKMIVSINNNDLIEFFAYKKSILKAEDLVTFAGTYYSSELDCNYEFRMKDDALILYINGDEIGILNFVADNLFENDDIGAFRFNKSSQSEFVLNSGRVRGIKFRKQ